MSERGRRPGGALRYPPKPAPGDRVAVLSPSAGAPARFPAPYELGLARIRQQFGLVPVEYPTTRAPEARPEERAADIHAAYRDPEIKAVIASIGGEDEIKVLRHLDPDILGTHLKPFFGYSDNTNLLHFLWGLGVVAYHGGAVMLQWGRPGAMHPLTEASLRRAMFDRGDWVLPAVAEYTDEEQCDWSNPASLAAAPALEPAAPWEWAGPARQVAGPSWGGSLEIIDFQLRAGRYVQPLECYDGAVLFLETSEELPPASYVYRVLLGMGERGLLQRFSALLVGRPKAVSLDNPRRPDAKAAYAHAQREAVLAAVGEYHPHLMVVFNVDFGHTDPQLAIPHGGWLQVDGVARRITVRY